jgi:heat shock protein HslJ
MIRLALAATLLAAFALAGCDERLTAPTREALTGAWRLQSLHPAGVASQMVSDPDRFTLEFLDDGRVHARADCNRCAGAYALMEGALTVGPLGCTRAACSLAQLEAAYTRILQATTSAEIAANTLRLTGPAGVAILTR